MPTDLDAIRPTAGDVLSCGDIYPGPPSGGGASGYAISDAGETLCYAHADERQRAELAALPAGETFGAYVGSAGDLTTWTGGRLADAVPAAHGISRNGWNGSEIHSWRFVGPDGTRYYGRNGGPGMSIGVRRMAAGK